MKIIRTILFSLLAFTLIVCTGIFILFQTFDTDQYLSPITKKASLALGRSVSIEHLGLGLSSLGITLDAGPVIIGDDPGFTSQPFIKIDKVRIILDLRSLVLQREIHITGILLQAPQIHFIRSEEGNINIRSIGQVNRSPITFTSSSVHNQEQPKQQESTKKPINIKFIQIQGASISFIDQNQTTPLDIWLNGINASLDDFSFSRPFQLSFDTSVLMLKGILPGMPDSPVLKNIMGNVQLNLAHLDAGPGGITANGDISSAGGVIKHFNIIKTILSHTLGSFGGIEGNIDNILNGHFKDNLGADDTVIEKVQAQFSFHDKTIFIDDSLLQTNVFEFTAKGSVDQGLNMDMQTMLRLNSDVSTGLVNELDSLKLLYDDSHRIAIDASLKGVIPHLKYKPNKDFRKKSKRALIQEGGNILGVLFGGGKI